MDSLSKKKHSLLVSSVKHRDAMKSNIKEISTKIEKSTKDLITIAGVIGGAFALFNILQQSKFSKGKALQRRLAVVLKQQVSLLVLKELRKIIQKHIKKLDESKSKNIQ